MNNDLMRRVAAHLRATGASPELCFEFDNEVSGLLHAEQVRQSRLNPTTLVPFEEWFKAQQRLTQATPGTPGRGR
jgi:hypothetical protein